mmetsp:Transcript_931/g.1004  ORF Transcript_931/g.1004 Transcript_931/m.1004 type:complete len:93 (+) Transcript_931:170-448(+)
MERNINYTWERTIQALIVVSYVFRHGRVLDESGRFPYEGEVGRRRHQQIEQVLTEIVAPVAYILFYALMFRLIRFFAETIIKVSRLVRPSKS